MTIEEAIKNREECLKYLEGLGAMATPENVEAARWSLKALRAYAEKPPCYLEEKDDPYPLCVGRGFANCAHCCLWADFDVNQDESRVNPPLTLDQLRGMDGEPVWVVPIGDRAYANHGWGVVSLKTELIATGYTCRWEMKLYGKGFIAYRYKPKEAQHDE